MSEPQSVTGLLDLAIRHHQAGDLSGAERTYRQILEIEVNHGGALLLFGMLLASGPAVKEAEALFRRFLGFSPDAPLSPDALSALDERLPAEDGRGGFEQGTALFELGKLRLNEGDNAVAARLFDAALRHVPDSAPTYRALCLSLHRSGRTKPALAAIDRAIAIEPGFASDHLNRGLILVALRRMPDGVAAFGKAVEIAPDWAEGWANLGNTWHLMGDFAQAETAMRRAIALDGDNIQARFELAQILERQKRFEEARACSFEAGRRHGIGVHPCRGGVPQARVLLIGGAGSCNLLPEFLFDRGRYELLTTYLVPPDAEDMSPSSLAERLPPFDIAFNALADLDRGGEFMPLVAGLCDQLQRPVLNPPDHRISRTRRDRVASLLEGIAGLVVPPTRRLLRAELIGLSRSRGSWEQPILVRPVGTHGGDDFHRIENAAQLDAYLTNSQYDE